MKDTIQEILNKIKKEQQLSYGEIVFLQQHQAFIKEHFPNDIELWEWSGIEEQEWLNK